jgi:ArsR family transcriptional regulator
MVDARTFQALSDPTRLKILSLLGGGSMNVTAMVEKLDCTQPAVSRHLKVLREAGLIVDARHGKWIEYSGNPSTVGEVAEYLKALYKAGGEGGAAAPANVNKRPAPGPAPQVRKHARDAGARAGVEAGPEKVEAGKKPDEEKSRYVIERDEDFIDDLML